MNGRVYDYQLGRFLSVDPHIDAPLNSQSLNPYSYIMNNPLAGTDPTGYDAQCAGGEHTTGDDSGCSGNPPTNDNAGGRQYAEAPTGSHIAGNEQSQSSGGAGGTSGFGFVTQVADDAPAASGQKANGAVGGASLVASGVNQNQQAGNSSIGSNSTLPNSAITSPAAGNTPTDSGQTDSPADTDQQKKVDALVKAQDSALSKKSLQPSRYKKKLTTHCSEGTLDIADAAGADTTPLRRSDGRFADADDQASQLAAAAAKQGSGWHLISLDQGQSQSNLGRVVVYAWANSDGHGHTVTGRPDPNNPRAPTDPTVANLGPRNKVTDFRNAFGSGKRAQVKVYVYTGD